VSEIPAVPSSIVEERREANVKLKYDYLSTHTGELPEFTLELQFCIDSTNNRLLSIIPLVERGIADLDTTCARSNV